MRLDELVDADVIVVGAGLAGLAATAELASAGLRVLLLDQEPESNLGGQAFWSFGGLFLVDSPEQRRMGIKDSRELAWQDWTGSAYFDRGIDDPAAEDYWAYRWAQAYVDFAAGEKRSWLHAMGMRWFPLVGWAERGGYLADGHGNSVPRFHVTWGTGPGVLAPFERRVRDAAADGRVGFRFRHRADELTVTGGAVDGVRGAVLEPSSAARGTRSSRTEVGRFELHAPAVIVTSGGIGANFDLIRQNWPSPARAAAGAHDQRGTRVRRRADAGHRRTRRRAAGQPGPDVALHRGHRELGSDLGPARHQDLARALVDVVRRPRPAVPGAELPRLRHPGHAGRHPGERL